MKKLIKKVDYLLAVEIGLILLVFSRDLRVYTETHHGMVD